MTDQYLDRDASLAYLETERGVRMAPTTWYRRTASKANPIRTVKIGGKLYTTRQWIDDFIEREIAGSSEAAA